MLHIIVQTYLDNLSVIQTSNFKIVQSNIYRTILNKMTEFLFVLSNKPTNTKETENDWEIGFTNKT